jgi:hypothetical protein
MAPILDALLKPFRRGRRRNEPTRDTLPFPQLISLGQADPHSKRRVVYKSSPKNLRFFSHTPIARRAINAVKQPLAMLDWEITIKAGVTLNSELQRQIDTVTACLANPNDDDSFLTFVQQVTEDILVGAGAIEIGLSGRQDRPVFLWPVDGLSIQLLPAWNGGTNEARYLQTIGYGNSGTGWGEGIYLRNDELVYIRPNPSTATPFGFGPLEIAFNSISRQLAAGEFAGRLAGNALPPFMIDLGEADKDSILTFRQYWRNEVEGQGQIPIISTDVANAETAGKQRGPNAIRLYPEGDKALYLAYQEFLRTEIAAAFDISNMNLNVERDVNRNTAEVMEDRDWDGAIKPLARLIKAHLDREVIEAALGFSQIEFKWVGLDREDEQATAQILTQYFDRSIFTVNQVREKLGEEPAEGEWADMTHADIEIAKNAARSAGLIEDTELPSQGGGGNSSSSSNQKPAQQRQQQQRPAPKRQEQSR